MPATPMISFGIEFEYDMLDSRGRAYTSVDPHPYRTTANWDYQADPTAGCEIRSPVFTDVEQATISMKDQFSYWMEEVRGYVPYMYNRASRSLGTHIHVGRPNRRLTHREKVNISTCVANVYPFLATLHAQPLPSNRGLTSVYCHQLNPRYNEIISTDHYAEISDSHIGTVEFRIFDANIPQTTLLCAWIMQRIAQRHLRNNREHDRARYSENRANGLRYGLIGLDVPQQLREIRDSTERTDLPSNTGLRELLYLACRYYMNAYNVKSTLRLGDFEYFKEMCSNPDQFLNNVLSLVDSGERDRVSTWIAEAERLESIDQLIGMAEASRQTVVSSMIERAEEIPVSTHVVRTPTTRSQVREAFNQARFSVSRISEVPTRTPEQVASRISELLARNGDGFANGLESTAILDANQRFYVLHVSPRSEIVGTIAIRMSTGEISSLVVDRRFRRMGIGRRLLQHALRLDIPETYAYVRIGNDASLTLFQSEGFIEESRDGNTILLRRR
jgi:GNAT superfamily N-acetyltransferase